MKSTVQIDAERPEELAQIVGKSLDGNDKVNYNIDQKPESLTIEVKTDGLGSLRGCTDTVFRLTSLAKKLY